MSKSKEQSGPKTHRADANKPSPSEYKAVMHKDAKRGEWQGSFEPVPVVKILRELNGRKEKTV